MVAWENKFYRWVCSIPSNTVLTIVLSTPTQTITTSGTVQTAVIVSPVVWVRLLVVKTPISYDVRKNELIEAYYDDNRRRVWFEQEEERDLSLEDTQEIVVECQCPITDVWNFGHLDSCLWYKLYGKENRVKF